MNNLEKIIIITIALIVSSVISIGLSSSLFGRGILFFVVFVIVSGKLSQIITEEKHYKKKRKLNSQ